MADEWGTPVTDRQPPQTLKEGEAFIGTYRGFKVIESQFGPQKVHAFSTDDGITEVYGTGVLDYFLESHKDHKVKVLKTGGKIVIDEANDYKADEYKIWCQVCKG